MICPSCQQALPEPLDRFCIRCGAALPLEDAEAAAEPAPAPAVEPVPAPEPQPTGAPWDRRGEVGFLTGLVDTTLQVLSRPREFYRRMAVTGGLGGPLLYGVLVGYAGLIATAVYDAVFEALIGAEPPDLGLGPEFDQALAMLEGGPGLLAQLVLGPFALVIGMFVGSGLNHLGLMLVGGARRDFEATFRVGAYAKAASVASLVPMCGPLVAIVWSAVATIVGLQVVHDTTLGKAVAAVLLPLAVACCCCGGAVGLLAALAASAAG